MKLRSMRLLILVCALLLCKAICSFNGMPLNLSSDAQGILLILAFIFITFDVAELFIN